VGDARRFDLMAGLVAYEFPDRNLRIADAAGGKGYLSIALVQRGFRDVTMFDRRRTIARKTGAPFRYGGRLFSWTTKEEFGLVVGMHPDEATDHIVMYAANHSVPFVVCPCCIKPDAAVYWGGGREFWTWISHLERLAKGLVVERRYLRMAGKNLVLIGK